MRIQKLSRGRRDRLQVCVFFFFSLKNPEAGKRAAGSPAGVCDMREHCLFYFVAHVPSHVPKYARTRQRVAVVKKYAP